MANLHSNLKLFSSVHSIKELCLPVSEDDLSELLRQLSNTLIEFIEIIKIHDGILLGGDGRLENIDMTIFSAADAIATPTKEYPFLPKLIPEVFSFAQTGDFIFFYSENDDPKKRGVFQAETSSADWDEAKYLGHSLEAVLCGGSGWDVAAF